MLVELFLEVVLTSVVGGSLLIGGAILYKQWLVKRARDRESGLVVVDLATVVPETLLNYTSGQLNRIDNRQIDARARARAFLLRAKSGSNTTNFDHQMHWTGRYRVRRQRSGSTVDIYGSSNTSSAEGDSESRSSCGTNGDNDDDYDFQMTTPRPLVSQRRGSQQSILAPIEEADHSIDFNKRPELQAIVAAAVKTEAVRPDGAPQDPPESDADDTMPPV